MIFNKILTNDKEYIKRCVQEYVIRSFLKQQNLKWISEFEYHIVNFHPNINGLIKVNQSRSCENNI